MHADIAAAEAERRVYEEAEAEDANNCVSNAMTMLNRPNKRLRVSSMPSQPPLLWRENTQARFRESQQSVSKRARLHQSNEAPPTAEQPNASEWCRVISPDRQNVSVNQRNVSFRDDAFQGLLKVKTAKILLFSNLFNNSSKVSWRLLCRNRVYKSLVATR